MGCDGEHLLEEGRRDRVPCPEPRGMIGRSSMMMKKVARIGVISDKCQELSWQCPEHRCQFILAERPLARDQAPGWGGESGCQEGRETGFTP